jgi:DNA polymerase-3 subunit chi
VEAAHQHGPVNMPEVDFFILSDPEEAALLRAACRVVENAWGQGLRVYVLASDDAQATRMDEMLWTFRQDSFVPHELFSGGDTPAARVLIGTGAGVTEGTDVLVNLGADVPPWYALCTRIAEMVCADTGHRTRGRTRYRMYREAGAELRTHEV